MLDTIWLDVVYCFHECKSIQIEPERVLLMQISRGLVSKVSTQSAHRRHRRTIEANHYRGLPRASSRDTTGRSHARSCASARRVRSTVRDSSAGTTHERPLIAVFAARISSVKAQASDALDQQLLRFDGRGSASLS